MRNSANGLSRCACVWLICVRFIDDEQGENMYLWKLRLAAAASGVLMTLLECAKWLNSFRLMYIPHSVIIHGQFEAIFCEFRINFANRFAHSACAQHENSLAFGIKKEAAEELFNYERAIALSDITPSQKCLTAAQRHTEHWFSCVIAMRPPRWSSQII